MKSTGKKLGQAHLDLGYYANQGKATGHSLELTGCLDPEAKIDIFLKTKDDTSPSKNQSGKASLSSFSKMQTIIERDSEHESREAFELKYRSSMV